MKRYALALDLKEDEKLIQEYMEYHLAVWPEILASIRDSGIHHMNIYRYSNRLFILMETEDNFTFERKAQMDATNPKVQDWERLMWTYQQAIPGSKPGEKWVLMEQIFSL